MKRLLVIKCGAAGDVVRTTPLLHLFRDWEVDWLTAKDNRELLSSIYIHNVFDSIDSIRPERTYDLVVNLEDDEQFVASVMPRLNYARIFGSYLNGHRKIEYTPDAAEWFDLGLISRHGIKNADALKLKNRKSYQEMIFSGLGNPFQGEPYVMPDRLPPSDLKGDIAIAPKAGQRWPTKSWHYFDRLIADLSKSYTVNVLPTRGSLLEHVADIRQHRFVISPDSLPMHLALGLRIPCVTIFTCTSPWEIYDYNLLTKIISPKLDQYFYTREYVEDAVKCIPYGEVHSLVIDKLRALGVGD